MVAESQKQSIQLKGKKSYIPQKQINHTINAIKTAVQKKAMTQDEANDMILI